LKHLKSRRKLTRFALKGFWLFLAKTAQNQAKSGRFGPVFEVLDFSKSFVFGGRRG